MKRLACGLVLLGACIVGDRPTADNIACSDGSCACEASFGDCDGVPENGCEARLDIEADNCGACGTRCDNGRCQAGACACNDGFVDCNALAEDGCEAQLAVDPDNCGACGHDCLRGSCGGARCEPFLLSELGGFIYALAVDQDHAYFCDADTGTLYRVPKESGETLLLAYDQNCWDVATDGAALFWTVTTPVETLVRAVPVAGGDFTTIAIASQVEGFAAANGRAFFVDRVAGVDELHVADMSGDHSVLAAAAGTLTAMTLAGDAVLYGDQTIDSTTIYRVPQTGGAATPLVTTTAYVAGLVAADSSVYWLEQSAEGDSKIFRAPLAGGAAEELASSNARIESLLVDASGLYWTEAQGDRIVHANLEGGAPEVLAQYLDVTLPALGEDAIYWIDFPSHLFALAK